MANHSARGKVDDDTSEISEIHKNRNLKKSQEVEDTPFIEVHKAPIREGSGKREGKTKLPSAVSKNPPTYSENLSYYFSQFCGATSIHGVQYLGERGRFITEKIAWATVVTTVCCICVYLITKTYNKWVTSPVIVSFATKEKSISEIPFPAVTICPEVKFNPEVFNFTDVFLKMIQGQTISPDEDRYFEHFRLICVDEMLEAVGIPNDNLTIDFDMFFADLMKALPDFNPYNLTDITWLGDEYSGELQPILTSDGVCLTFNMLNYDEIFKLDDKNIINMPLNTKKARKWSLEAGYPDDDLDAYPERTFLAGRDGGFQINLFTNHSSLDNICSMAFQGFKIVLHHPSEMPNMNKHFRVPLDQAVFVAITPRMTTVSSALKPYDPEDRGCYFSDERSLMYFVSYTQENCLTECFVNYTLMHCKCLPFYAAYSKDIPICGGGSGDCVKASKVKYLAEERIKCNCLPFCTALEYNVEITQTSWKWRKLFQTLPRGDIFLEPIANYESLHLSHLTIYYKEMQFLPSERHELYGYVDFFSNVGGLLGLFIGFSVTSLIEIIYFLTLRLGCNIRRFGRNYWSGEPELITARS